MTLKKTNAVVSLISIFLFLLHALYQTISYAALFYNPFMTRLFGALISAAIAVHGIISCLLVFVFQDSKTILYKKLNLRTFLQRLSAGLMIVLLPLHIMSFSLLRKTAHSLYYILIEASQIIFFAALFLHISVSFTNALVTLGILSDIKKKKHLDAVIALLCALFFVLMSAIVTIGHIHIFYGR